MKSNDHWNDRNFQLYWNKIELVDQKTRDLKKNPFFSSTHKFYNKYGKKSCHFVGY